MHVLISTTDSLSHKRERTVDQTWRLPWLGLYHNASMLDIWPSTEAASHRHFWLSHKQVGRSVSWVSTPYSKQIVLLAKNLLTNNLWIKTFILHHSSITFIVFSRPMIDLFLINCRFIDFFLQTKSIKLETRQQRAEMQALLQAYDSVLFSVGTAEKTIKETRSAFSA